METNENTGTDIQHASNWTQHYNEDGIPYYHNKTTGVSTWEMPSEFKEDIKNTNGKNSKTVNDDILSSLEKEANKEEKQTHNTPNTHNNVNAKHANGQKSKQES